MNAFLFLSVVIPVTVWSLSLLIFWAYLGQQRGPRGFVVGLLPEACIGVLAALILMGWDFLGAWFVGLLLTLLLSVPYAVLMIGLIFAHRFKRDRPHMSNRILRALATGPGLALALTASMGAGLYLSDLWHSSTVRGAFVAWKPVVDWNEVPWKVSAMAAGQDYQAVGWCAEEFWPPAPPGKALVSGRSFDCENSWRSEVRYVMLEDGSRWWWSHTVQSNLGLGVENGLSQFVGTLLGFDLGGLALYGVGTLSRRVVTISAESA